MDEERGLTQYEINQKNKEEFLEICSKVERRGFDNLLKWLDASDFYTAPASTRYHGAYVGGLLQHSLNVYHELVKILDAYKEIEVDEESVIICSLMHDLCKVDFYGSEKRNRKNENGKWESYDAFMVDEKFKFGGHGSKSVYLLQSFIRLKPEEAVAVNCHMGSFDNEYVGNSYEQFPFAWALHVADEAATFLRESE